MCTNPTNDQDNSSDYPAVQAFIDQINTSRIIKTLTYLGFPVDQPLIDQINAQIRSGVPEFIVSVAESLDAGLAYSASLDLHWNTNHKGYTLFRYTAYLHFPADPSQNRQQTFYLTNGKGISFREAYNLLQGRAVNKDLTSVSGETYNVWCLLNFGEKDSLGNYKIDHYRSRHRYDLEKVLELYPIEEMEDAAKKKELIRCLLRGDAVLVTLLKRKKKEQVLIAANPVLKTINIIPMSHTDK